MRGVGIVHLSEDRRWYRYEPDPEPSLGVVEGDCDGVAAYEALVTQEMNRPFPRPTCRPLRFNILSCDRDFHYVSTTYDHWTADSVALRLILRGILGRYMDLDLPEAEDSLTLYPATYRKAFGHHFGKLKLAAAAMRSMRRWNRNRMAWRVACWSNTRVGRELSVLHARRRHGGEAENLRPLGLGHGSRRDPGRFGKGLGAGDAGAGAEPRHGPGQHRRYPLRGRCRLEPLPRRFLSYYLVRCQGDGSQGLAETTRRIAALTGPVKARQGYLDSLINMQVTNLVWPWLSAAPSRISCDRLAHDRRRVRTSSSANRGSIAIAMRSWATIASRPTGLMLPLVITPTTLGDTMNLGVTYRVTGFTRAKIDGLMATVS